MIHDHLIIQIQFSSVIYNKKIITKKPGEEKFNLCKVKSSSPVLMSNCQPGPAHSSPARFEKYGLAQPSPVATKVSPTIPGRRQTNL